MRPNTPIPYGCSLTLLSCHINLEPEHHQPSIPVSPDRKFSIYHPKSNEFTHRQKQSLRNRNSKNTLRESVGITGISNFSQSDCNKYNDGFSEVSSMSGPQFSKRDRKETYKIKPQIQTCESQNKLSAQKQNQQFSQIFDQNKENFIIHNQKFDDGQIFAEEITLNLKNGSQLIERETAHTNNVSQRRVITQENKKQSRVFFTGEKSNKIYPQISMSQQMTSDQYRNVFSTNTPKVMKNSATIFSEMGSGATVIPTQHVRAIKKISKFQGKTSLMDPRIEKEYYFPPSAFKQTKLEEQKVYSEIPKSDVTHFRKPSSPKKFHTLVDLQCKNIDSSGGQHTSSNHVSIVTSQPSFDATIRDQGAGDFTRIIKLMTLKTLPLNEGLWLNMQKNTQ